MPLDNRDRSMTGRLDVLHVLEASLGGTRRYLENIATASGHMTLRMGLAYSMLRADEGFRELLPVLAREGWQLDQLDFERGVGIHDVADAVELREIILRRKPRIVHGHSSKAGALVRLATLAMRDPPKVFYSPHALAEGRAYRGLERLLAPLTSRYVAVSESERQQIVARGLAPAKRVDVVYPSIDGSYFAPRDRSAARARLGIDEGDVIVGIGRLVSQKDPLSFLRVVANVVRDRPLVRAIWVGDGELSDAFDRAIESSRLQHSVLRRPWSNDIRDEIAAANLVLSTARFESFGFVVAEAMSMERVVVASRVTGTSDVLDDEWTSNLFDVGRAEVASAFICDLLDHPTRAAALGTAGRLSVARRFSNESMRVRLSTIYC